MLPLDLLAISIGNTRTRLGLFQGRELRHAAALPSSDPAAIAQAIQDLPLDRPDTPVLMASVNPTAANAIAAAITPDLESRGARLVRFGPDFPVPIVTALDDDSTVGQDRLLNALGAFSRSGQACVVIDCGTAITADFVDGQGVFQGGAIAPGLNLMLHALHTGTAALPALRFEPVTDERPFGKSTPEAIRLGVQSAARGLVRVLVERYAVAYEAFPPILATGGDAAVLFEGDDLVEHIVPDLTLMGIQAACERLLGEDQHHRGPAAEGRDDDDTDDPDDDES